MSRTTVESMFRHESQTESETTESVLLRAIHSRRRKISAGMDQFFCGREQTHRTADFSMSTTTLPELEDPEPDMLRAAERSMRVPTDIAET